MMLINPSSRARHYPLLAEPALIPPWTEPISLFDSFASFHPSREEIFDVLVHGSTGREIPKSRRLGEIHLEIAVSPAEAIQGGAMCIEFPVAQICSRCNGTGRTGFFRCDACDGAGVSYQDARVELVVPPSAADSTIPVSLHHLDIAAIDLKVHVRVAGG
jgi:hypothetical protein